MLGGTKCAAAEEQVTIDFAFATVVAIRDIKKRREFYEREYLGKTSGNRRDSGRGLSECIRKKGDPRYRLRYTD